MSRAADKRAPAQRAGDRVIDPLLRTLNRSSLEDRFPQWRRPEPPQGEAEKRDDERR